VSGYYVDYDHRQADLVHLNGYALDTSTFYPGGTLTVILNWRAVTSLNEDFVVFTHLLDEAGRIR